jgi:DNA-binding protein YbaB
VSDDHRPEEDSSNPIAGPVEAYEADEDYEERLARGLEALDSLPRDDDWEHTRRVIENAPSRADIEAAAQGLAQAQELLAALVEARYTGVDPDGLVKVVIDTGGRIQDVAFDVAAVRVGARTASEAVQAAWIAAEAERDADGVRFEEMSRRLGGQGR